LHRLDELSGGSVFSELYEHEVKGDVFPDLAETYQKLGLRVSSEGKVILSEGAPRQRDRDAIMRYSMTEPDPRSNSK